MAYEITSDNINLYFYHSASWYFSQNILFESYGQLGEIDTAVLPPGLEETEAERFNTLPKMLKANTAKLDPFVFWLWSTICPSPYYFFN